MPRVTLAGASVQVKPDTGDTIAARLTAPVKPFTVVREIVEVPDEPVTREMPVGLAFMVKSAPV